MQFLVLANSKIEQRTKGETSVAGCSTPALYVYAPRQIEASEYTNGQIAMATYSPDDPRIVDPSKTIGILLTSKGMNARPRKFREKGPLFPKTIA